MNQIDVLRGNLSRDNVKLEIAGKEILYDTSFFGQPRDDHLELALIEAAYLIYKGRINVTMDFTGLDFENFMCEASHRAANFEVKYIVYKDLRERGYFIKPGAADFRIYPRGGRPGKTPSRYFVCVLSERHPLPLPDILPQIEAAVSVKKEMVMAVVDEESDITFYGLNLCLMKGSMDYAAPSDPAVRATFLDDRVVVWDGEASGQLHNKYFYGKPLDQERLQLSLIEAAYLQEKNFIVLGETSSSDLLSPEEFANRAVEVEKDFPKKLAVYRNLRDSGMVVKTGYKFGTHFRVYTKVDRSEGMRHSEFLVQAIDHNHIFNLPQLSGAVRLAHSVKKRMVFAWQAREDIKYLEITRIKM